MANKKRASDKSRDPLKEDVSGQLEKQVDALYKQGKILTKAGVTFTGLIEAFDNDGSIALSSVLVKYPNGHEEKKKSILVYENIIKRWTAQGDQKPDLLKELSEGLKEPSFEAQKSNRPSRSDDHPSKSRNANGVFRTDREYPPKEEAESSPHADDLKHWEPEPHLNGPFTDGDLSADGKTWDPDQMFAANAKLGVKSDFKGIDGNYTTAPIVGDEEARKRAEQLEKDILKNPESRRNAEIENMDEEREIGPEHDTQNDMQSQASTSRKRPESGGGGSHSAVTSSRPPSQPTRSDFNRNASRREPPPGREPRNRDYQSSKGGGRKDRNRAPERPQRSFVIKQEQPTAEERPANGPMQNGDDKKEGKPGFNPAAPEFVPKSTPGLNSLNGSQASSAMNIPPPAQHNPYQPPLVMPLSPATIPQVAPTAMPQANQNGAFNYAQQPMYPQMLPGVNQSNGTQQQYVPVNAFAHPPPLNNAQMQMPIMPPSGYQYGVSQLTMPQTMGYPSVLPPADFHSQFALMQQQLQFANAQSFLYQQQLQALQNKFLAQQLPPQGPPLSQPPPPQHGRMIQQQQSHPPQQARQTPAPIHHQQQQQPPQQHKPSY